MDFDVTLARVRTRSVTVSEQSCVRENYDALSASTSRECTQRCGIIGKAAANNADEGDIATFALSARERPERIALRFPRF